MPCLFKKSASTWLMLSNKWLQITYKHVGWNALKLPGCPEPKKLIEWNIWFYLTRADRNLRGLPFLKLTAKAPENRPSSHPIFQVRFVSFQGEYPFPKTTVWSVKKVKTLWETQNSPRFVHVCFRHFRALHGCGGCGSPNHGMSPNSPKQKKHLTSAKSVRNLFKKNTVLPFLPSGKLT